MRERNVGLLESLERTEMYLGTGKVVVGKTHEAASTEAIVLSRSILLT